MGPECQRCMLPRADVDRQALGRIVENNCCGLTFESIQLLAWTQMRSAQSAWRLHRNMAGVCDWPKSIRKDMLGVTAPVGAYATRACLTLHPSRMFRPAWSTYVTRNNIMQLTLVFRIGLTWSAHIYEVVVALVFV